jgi:hypothetical protein
MGYPSLCVLLEILLHLLEQRPVDRGRLRVDKLPICVCVCVRVCVCVCVFVRVCK